jgi:predicted glycoside hydrolase/deacetylase ChbG (UPF0249 family)
MTNSHVTFRCTLPAALCLVLLALAAMPAILSAAEPAEPIRLIVRGDDIGSSHAANLACIRSFREGIVRSVEVMVPGPWYPEAVKLLKENPGLDVGVHLTLTSEWENVKWGPITHGPSLVDLLGHFFPMTGQRPDFPPNTGFLEAKPKLDEVERELRAQIELARADIAHVSHLSCHMGTPTATPQLRALVMRLSAEYKLPLDPPGVRFAGAMGGPNATPQQKEAALVKVVERLSAGLWLLVEHPGMDTPEMQAIGHLGYENVAADRQGVTEAFTSEKVKAAIARRGVQLVSYGEALGK